MNPIEPAGYFRQMAALIYDALLVIAILLLASAISTAVVAWVRPGYQQANPTALSHDPMNILYLFSCWFGYYAVSWIKGGQTLGMKAWKIKLINQYAGRFLLRNLLARFVTALCGIGTLMVLVHPQKMSLQDYFSGTKIIYIPPQK